MAREPPWPLNEPARIDRLKSYGVLDTPAEEAFDRITRLVARHFDAPMALVTLLDETRQWFKARHGVDLSHTSRRISFCAYTILENRVMVVPDATEDERFADNPLVVDPPHIRFYAGAPLTAGEGLVLGTLCILDRRRRDDFGPERQQDLAEFARIAMHDLDMKRTLAELESAREEAQRANDAKTRFLAAASHDLRQPIQAASLYTGLLGYQLTDPETRELLERLQASIDGLNGMLGGLLDLSRLEAGAIVPELKSHLPGELMARLTAEFRAQAELKGLRLRHRACNLPVLTDPHLLERMLRNLLSNAVTYTQKGGVLLACRRRGGEVEFQVWDTGPGIAEEHRRTVFEEFRQLGKPARNGAQGFGLGLAIVNRIARLLGLAVTVRSVPERGSLFAVRVPLARHRTAPGPRATATPPAVRDAARFQGRTVLVVEDDDAVRLAMTMLLESWGVNVVAARTREEFAELLRDIEEEPDALVTDYRLPNGQTGREVVEMVRARWKLPAVIITGDTAPERLREALATGCRLLHKPVEPKDLARVLDEMLPG
ncbi:ATP-binding protein [Azospirillum sp. SYSU D00513]|uniref:hybrid sensor histidine kinase/response regulator n=1 Tax=Azospirillum sp. SYSU D00513 TaxID=2812561 RepID=UPI001A976324|nr:ATP-binding protein [Azospirillum sp. SYSU D00513]